jgi:cytoskeletal protein CcmA (bactofilin family)
MWNKTNEPKLPSPSPERAVPIVPASTPEPVASAPTGRVTSKISSGLKIHGDVFGDADLYIDGEVQGKICLTNSRVTVGPNGRVQADVEARELIIDGSLQGNLKAGMSTRLGQSCRVLGSILTPRLAIDGGAQLRGKVETIPAKTFREPSAADETTDSEGLRPVSAGTKAE